ncbi:unnamed protein product [Anisakis simplex]|uniref:Voltage-dependent anion-selective channel protein 3 n=1 Tax=Anisakis simplex TaxID=6269 RepID=A0A0M3K232_ANISI|nr:unnamed protein product [Anisakis simplex]
MTPPAFVDLGKAAKDLFTKEYNHGFLKVESTTHADQNGAIEFKTGGVHTIASGRVAGNVDVKYKLPSYGFTLTEKWNTENMLGTVIEVKDQFAKGLKVTFDSCFAPQLGKRTSKVKGEWSGDRVKVNCDLGLDAGVLLNMSGVTEFRTWLIGVQTCFDTTTSKLRNTNVAFGKIGPDYVIHSFVNNGQEFGASLYHRAAPAKVDNQAKVAFASTHHLSDKLKLILSTQFAMDRLNEGGHKFGFGLVYTQ